MIDWPNRETFRNNVTPERIVEEAKAFSENSPNRDWDQDDELTPNDVIVDFSTMHYGMKERNPLDSIEFYSKRRPNCKYEGYLVSHIYHLML